MKTPMDLPEAMARGLVAPDGSRGISTFPNGTTAMDWMEDNCIVCHWYDIDGCAGEYCAFEGAALLGAVTPDLARLFGWLQHPEYPDSFDPPRRCPFLRLRLDDGDGDAPRRPPPPDPLQLVLIADPTEDAALLAPSPSTPALLPVGMG